MKNHGRIILINFKKTLSKRLSSPGGMVLNLQREPKRKNILFAFSKSINFAENKKIIWQQHW